MQYIKIHKNKLISTIAIIFAATSSTQCIANTGHSASLSYGSYEETLSAERNSVEISPLSLQIAYSYQSQQGFITSLSAWMEDEDISPATNTHLTQKNKGLGIGSSWPLAWDENLRIDVYASYTSPSLELAYSNGSYVRETTEIQDFNLGLSYFFIHENFSFTPSLSIGTQHTSLANRIQTRMLSTETKRSENGQYIGSSLTMAYGFDLNNARYLNTFIYTTWTEFVSGEGSSSTNYKGRQSLGGNRFREISLTQQSSEKLENDGSGVYGAGASLFIGDYSFTAHLENTINASNLGGSYTLSAGVDW